MKKHSYRIELVIALVLLSICSNQKPARSQPQQNWTHFVRIAGHGLNLNNVDNIIKSATETHVFGIETDNDIPGRYESFLDPTEKLKAIKAVADKAHQVGNYAFVYIAGLECITANADKTEHTFFKDHPDWLQRKITGEPAIFGGGTAFWIDEGDEDVWISPYAQEWRKIYMERVRQIAATGIDGVYVDIPYWMTHFDGWEDSWASFDDYTVAAFKERTGLNAKTDLKRGDFSDSNFRKWVDFRIATLTAFMKEIDDNVKAANPKCMTIAEIYPGIEESAVRVGADVYDMYPAVDVIAHEYDGSGEHAASKNPLHWFSYLSGMYTFRAFADEKASWMLTYSWDGEEKINPAEAMKNLALANVMAGTNCWDARGHVMSGSNDMATRKEIFKWIASHEKTLYSPRQPINAVGVYFSPQTRNYFADEFMAAYKGIIYLLMQVHLEFQIVTPRNRQNFTGEILILPDAKCLGNEELSFFEGFTQSGQTLIVTGETGKYNGSGQMLSSNPLHERLGIMDATQPQHSNGGMRFSFYPNCPGKAYHEELDRAFNKQSLQGEYLETSFYRQITSFANELSGKLGHRPAVEIKASPFVSTQIAQVNGKPHVFIANFKGLKGKEKAVQSPEKEVTIIFPAKPNAKVYTLPFLGRLQETPSEWRDGKLTCVIPEINKGVVVWCQ
ncbi:MAG: hypothetical protein ACREOO_05570 [bacterium]